ncbi:MAG TPA: hypothetical protein VK213_05575 [Bacteroidales bacterium]|nr:hypothetical protein [Bacteroidales bacterium]
MTPVITVIFILFSAISLMSGMQAGVPADSGYRDIVVAGGKILAAGTNGRLDYYEAAPSAASFSIPYKSDISSVISVDRMILAAGARGYFIISEDGRNFKVSNTGTAYNINGITMFKNVLVAGADNGTILVSTDGISFGHIQPGVRGNILSVDSNDSFCIGVTDAGEIIKSEDGFTWRVTDFNKEYKGYYQQCTFSKVILTEDRIAVAGSHADNSPALFFSTSGSVWNERALNYEDERGDFRMMESQINDIAYDADKNVFLLACDDGFLMIIPSCSKCNELMKVTEKDIRAICLSEGKIVIAGQDFFIKDLAFNYN